MLAISFWDIVGWHVISQKCHLIASARFVIKTNRMLVCLSNIPPKLKFVWKWWTHVGPIPSDVWIICKTHPNIELSLILWQTHIEWSRIPLHAIVLQLLIIWFSLMPPVFGVNPSCLIRDPLWCQAWINNWWGYPQNGDNLPSKLLPLLFDGLAVFSS